MNKNAKSLFCAQGHFHNLMPSAGFIPEIGQRGPKKGATEMAWTRVCMEEKRITQKQFKKV